MFYYPKIIKDGEDFTRILMKRLVSGDISGLSIDVPQRWTYKQIRDWISAHYKVQGWYYSRSAHYAYSTDEKQWIKVPGIVRDNPTL